MAFPTLLLALSICQGHGIPLEAPPAPDVTLDPLYHPLCGRPGELVGFSFLDPLPELRQAVELGANSALANWMWIPVPDDTSPTGMSGPPLTGLIGAPEYSQEVTIVEPVSALGLVLPVYQTEGAPIYLRVYQAERDVPLSVVFEERPVDNAAVFVPGDYTPGTYTIEIELAGTGPGRVGVWARAGGRPSATAGGWSLRPLHLEAVAQRPDGSIVPLYEEGSPHMPLELTPNLLEAWKDLGLQIGIYVGNWNNGAFPYYPDWFYERFPDAAMLDQNGEPFLTGMFDRQVPWLGISHPVIVAGTAEHIERTVEALAQEEILRYWVLGGESLYYTYFAETRLTDFSPYALDHFRGWLRTRYQEDLGRLNEAWGTAFATWAEVTPPGQLQANAGSVDFALFRFREMAERFGWHYQSVRSHDTQRLALSCNHGDLFGGRCYFGLGLDPPSLAQATDGFELGQIMRDDDGQRYNLLWMYSVMAQGKPLAAPRLAYAKTDPSARGGSRSYTPEAARRYFGEAIGTGCWHTGFVQWYGDLPDGEWGVRGTPAEAEFRAIFKEWHGIEHEFDGCWPLRPRIGLLRSRPTWAVEGYQPVWQAIHEELIRRGLGYTALSGDTRWDGLDVVICADNPILEDSDRTRLTTWLAEGGVVIASGSNGALDEACRAAAEVASMRGVVAVDAQETPLVQRAALLVDAALEHTMPPVQVDLEGMGPIVRQVTSDLFSGAHDRPLDLANGAVVQSFAPVEEGLRAVLVSIPTFSQEYDGDPLTLEVTNEQGAVLGSATVDRAVMKDNAWHEVAIDAPCAAGETLRLRVAGPEGLAPLKLGVWSSTTARAGTLTQGDTLLPGALAMKLRYQRLAAPAEVLEIFPLSDGAGTIVVLVNISDVPIRFRLQNAEDLAVVTPHGLTIRRLDGARELGDDVVPPYRTAFVAIHRAPPLPEAAAWLSELTERLGEQGRESGVRRAYLDRAREALASDMPHKALAHGLAAARWVEPNAQAVVEGNTLVVSAHPEVMEGSNADQMVVECRLVPLGGPTITLEAAGDGQYRAAVPLAALPLRYDYSNRRYETAWGPVGIEVQCRSGALQGGERITTDLPRATHR